MSELIEAVRNSPGPAAGPALQTPSVRWSRAELLAAARELAGPLAAAAGGRTVVAAASDPAATAVLTLAGDLAALPILHADPAAAALPPGLVVRDGAGSCVLSAGGLDLAAEVTGPAPAGPVPPVQLFLTSGSTGRPVQVARDARAVLADARRVAAELGYGPAAPVVGAVAVGHVYGFAYALLGPLVSGAPVTLRGPRTVPTQLVRLVREGRARTLISHPALYRLLAADAGCVSALSGLTGAVSAGAALGEGVAAALARLPLRNCYGSSEAGAVTLSPVTGREPSGDVGVPLPGVLARVDGTGELLLRTESLAAGRMVDGRLEPLPAADGWFRTGDLAELAGPRLRLRGRLADVINVAGRKVAPREVEQVLAAHPAVAEAQVLGVDDPARGRVPLARIVRRHPVTDTELVRWCRGRLAPYQLPHRFEFVSELPRSVAGKLLGPR